MLTIEFFDRRADATGERGGMYEAIAGRVMRLGLVPGRPDTPCAG